MKKILLVVGVIVLILFLNKNNNTNNSLLFPSFTRKVVKINTKTFTLFLADSPEKQEGGLSYIKEIPSNYGMIFTFKQKGRQQFWMKSMLFPLDFVYLNDNVIVDIKENVSPATYPILFSGRKQYNAVIEFNAGVIKKNKINIKQNVTFL